MKPTTYLLFILLFPLIGSFIGYTIGKSNEKYRDIFNIVMTAIVFLVTTILYKYVVVQPIEISIPNVMGTGLHLKLDMFRYVFVCLTTMIWFLTTLYSTQYLINHKNRNRYYLFFMLTLASTIGIFISENFLNLFTFFEIMSFTSYALIINDEDDYSHNAGNTYIIMAVTGGLILLMGLFLLYNSTQTLDISELRVKVSILGNIKYLIVTLIIIGFGVKAGMVPLHIWLPKAYPAAPTPATVVLSAVLAKTGIFGIILTIEVIMSGDFIISIIILVIGFLNMFIGGILAMMQRNVKRILAYSSMSQIGYILVGIGLIGILKENRIIAIYGTLYHVINHGIFKALLFMGTGTIYLVLNELSINKIGGFGIDKHLLKILFFIGMLSIIGMPGFNGFTSKTMLHEAIIEAEHMYGGVFFKTCEFVFIISSSFTVAYLLKIFVAVFIDKSNHDIEKVVARISKRALIPMVILSLMSIYIGMSPSVILHVLDKTLKPFGNPNPLAVSLYTFDNIKSSMVIIIIGIAIYMGFIRRVLKKGEGTNWYYVNPTTNWISLEKHIYKPLGKSIIFISSFIFNIIDGAVVNSVTFIGNGIDSISKIEIEQGKSIVRRMRSGFIKLFSSKGNIDKIDIETEKSELINIKKKIEDIGYNMNSLTYSLFIFGIVLIVCLLFLMS
ncbi:complex I subunit 5 family protein [Clostridium bowmanii]|uniref:complex I subunit 5 family protein n=1 Tax=Clostridium bowmanii TaxID=132925 RepID=UPI001C0CEE3D|nr:complex I subunit 5 family protein [Clostridium bowmanii]MBU3189292.1 complex I subunit 5 family protein [Clostridium bowmanii]MCA1073176.1 complex I subunit 5 family protein [Clostridium bowmanii]